MKSFYLIKPYLLENRYRILLGIACLVAVDFLQLFIPRVIKWAVDDIAAFQIDAMNLAMYALYIVGIAIAIGLLRYVWRHCLIGTSRRVEEGLRNKLFAHVQTLSASYFDTAKTGDLMAHATNDIQHIRMATGMGTVALTDAIVLGTAAIGSEHMYIAAKRRGVEALLVVYPGEDHSVDQPKHVQDLYDRYLAWFERLVKGEKGD